MMKNGMPYQVNPGRHNPINGERIKSSLGDDGAVVYSYLQDRLHDDLIQINIY